MQTETTSTTAKASGFGGRKGPTAGDKHVGNRIRQQRLMRQLSQTELANHCGITFQQIQKYENGTNRVGANRLQQIANCLDTDVSFFFAGIPGASGISATSSKADQEVQAVLATPDGVAMVRAFARLQTPALRRRFVQLAEAVIGQRSTLGEDAG